MASDIDKNEVTKLAHRFPAPGRPGIKPHWNTGAKVAVGTAVNVQSRIWFTLAHGHLNEIYFADVDCANTKFVRFIVAGEDGMFSDEESDTDYAIQPATPGIPAFSIESQCKRDEYRLLKEIIADPERDALLLRVRFAAAHSVKHLGLYVFANPHMGDQGASNTGWAGHYKGIPMLFAERSGLAMAIACSTPFKSMHCGFLGESDGLKDLRSCGKLRTHYTQANRGNVALLGEIDWEAAGGQFTVAIGFGGGAAEAGLQARAAIYRPFDEVQQQYIAGWEDYQKNLQDLSRGDDKGLFRISAAVSRIHESKRFPGAFVASLSIPWGFDRGDKDTGGYHVIWPRDLCQTALGLLACGDADSGRRALLYLQCTQDADGHWNQNQWLDGTKHWTSRQMDETSFPVLLADALRRAGELRGHDPWDMVKRTAEYMLQHGPLSQEDRWEEVPGYAVYTMAVEIAALLAAADFADLQGETEMASFLRKTADAWNEAIDELTYVTGTELARECGVAGYYTRITPPETIHGKALDSLMIDLKNHRKGRQKVKAVGIASTDPLALVRFGLRAADDPRILDTVKVIDAKLKKATSTGPVWRRYVDDGYGEHEDGSPFNGTGVGRGWPLLAGERAHYEIARGNFDFAEELRRTMEAQTSECGLIPEQIWDAPDIPERELFSGRPSGSGMPLVWAHAEYIQLLRSLRDGHVWSTPPQTIERYLRQRTEAPYQIWKRDQARGRLRAGKNLRIDWPSPATVHWTTDDWRTAHATMTEDSGLCVHWALLNVSGLQPGTRIRFRLAGTRDFQVVVW